jgi:hypothetical protein
VFQLNLLSSFAISVRTGLIGKVLPLPLPACPLEVLKARQEEIAAIDSHLVVNVGLLRGPERELSQSASRKIPLQSLARKCLYAAQKHKSAGI